MKLLVRRVAANRAIAIAPGRVRRIAYTPDLSTRPKGRDAFFTPLGVCKSNIEFQLVERILISLLGGVRPFHDDMLKGILILGLCQRLPGKSTNSRGPTKGTSRH